MTKIDNALNSLTTLVSTVPVGGAYKRNLRNKVYAAQMTFLNAIHEELIDSGVMATDVDGVLARNKVEMFPKDVAPYKHTRHEVI